ncbi:MAG: Uncharacterised protein [Flavobacteriales bacterium UBA4585]|nr:MAG: Uncharacterised protein [Flavobacteriales bacterium UBA4585]
MERDSLSLQSIPVTTGFPKVSVPVLSRIANFTSPANCKAAASLINNPFLLPIPVAATTASGVANPNAHGHAMTSTSTA